MNRFPDAQTIESMKPMGMIITGSGSELRQFEELTKWLVDEEYKQYENLELEISHFHEPILRITEASGKTRDIQLRDFATRDAIRSLLSKYEFERKG